MSLSFFFFLAIVLAVLNAMLSLMSLNMLDSFLIWGLKYVKCGPLFAIDLFSYVGFLLALHFGFEFGYELGWEIVVVCYGLYFYPFLFLLVCVRECVSIMVIKNLYAAGFCSVGWLVVVSLFVGFL